MLNIKVERPKFLLSGQIARDLNVGDINIIKENKKKILLSISLNFSFKHKKKNIGNDRFK